MKIFKILSETTAVAKGRKWLNKGYELITHVKNQEEFFNTIRRLEDNDFFPEEETGFVYEANGNEVFDPSYPNDFDFGDYTYVLLDATSLDDHRDSHVIAALYGVVGLQAEKNKLADWLGEENDDCGIDTYFGEDITTKEAKERFSEMEVYELEGIISRFSDKGAAFISSFERNEY